jgi:hypothetical protein
MPLFSRDKEDNTKAPLMAGSALAALPAAQAINLGLETLNDLDDIPKGYTGKITGDVQDQLGSAILGKKRYSSLPVLTS